jgi:co-chaperonin GroES (HSP10)
MAFKPLHSLVTVVLDLKDLKTSGGLVLPDNFGDIFLTGTVRAAGPGVKASGGTDGHAGKVTGDTTRAVFTIAQDPSYFAKSRTLRDPVISFKEPADDSLWRIMYPGELA